MVQHQKSESLLSEFNWINLLKVLLWQREQGRNVKPGRSQDSDESDQSHFQRGQESLWFNLTLELLLAEVKTVLVVAVSEVIVVVSDH